MSGAATHCHCVYCDKMHKHTHARHTCTHLQSQASHPLQTRTWRIPSPCSCASPAWMCSCVRMFPSEWVGGRGGGKKRGQGTEGVIKLKRLGEDELLRIYESRHWLHKANPAHSAFKGALGGKGTRRTRWSGGEALCLDWYKPVQTDISMFRSFGWQRKGCWICFPNAQEQGQRSCQTIESRRKRYDRLATCELMVVSFLVAE